jgi:bifunctional non-homologous end joining protein LigD
MARPSPATRAECRASSASITADTTPACFLYAFDLVELNGDDLRRDPLEVRKAKLATVLARVSHGIWFNDHIEGDGPIVFRQACKLGLEGIGREGYR